MSRLFLVSDTHFGHRNICKFLRDDGTKLRPWDDTDTMDLEMIQRWNATVNPEDTVYHLGDVVMNRHCLPTISRLNGTKILIKGNHDTFRLDEYTRYFIDIRGSDEINNYLLTHYPVHPDSKGRYRGNIHGHLHYRKLADPWYQNVSVEVTDFKPILFEEFVTRFYNTTVDPEPQI